MAIEAALSQQAPGWPLAHRPYTMTATRSDPPIAPDQELHGRAGLDPRQRRTVYNGAGQVVVGRERRCGVEIPSLLLDLGSTRRHRRRTRFEGARRVCRPSNRIGIEPRRCGEPRALLTVSNRPDRNAGLDRFVKTNVRTRWLASRFRTDRDLHEQLELSVAHPCRRVSPHHARVVRERLDIHRRIGLQHGNPFNSIYE